MPIHNWAHARRVLDYLEAQEREIMAYDTWKSTEPQWEEPTDQQDQEETEQLKLHIEWSLTQNLYFIVDDNRYDISEGFESYLDAEAEMHRLMSEC